MSAAEGLDVQPINAVRPSSVVRPADEQLVLVRHDQLAPSPLNPRKHAREQAEIVELAASIADKGVLHNLVARPLKGEKDRYEIAAGEGRWLAVKHLIDTKAATAGYMLRVAVRELTDEQMIEIGLVENGRRRNLHPLDEAKAFHALYDAKVKAAGGKSKAAGLAAGAGVVRDLAAAVGRTPRYVQKRIALARNLVPAAETLLQKDMVSLAFAQTLAIRPASEQTKVLDNFRHWQTKTFDEERLRHAGAEDAARDLIRKWRPLAHAIFPAAAYTGPTEEIDGVIFATDAKAFDALQQERLNGLVNGWKSDAAAGRISFVDVGRRFDAWKYQVKTDAAGKPDPKGGIVVEKDDDGAIRVHKGLFKTKQALAQEKADAAYRSQAAKSAAQSRRAASKPPPPPPKPDARVPQVAKFMEASQATVLAVDIFNGLANWQDSIDWAGGDFFLEPETRKRVVELIGRNRRGAFPKGGELLKWLLKQPLSALLKPWLVMRTAVERDVVIRKPSAAALALFDHCGAKLPKPDPKAAPAAKKPKPTTTKKGRKS